jgi:hypothetical protein
VCVCVCVCVCVLSSFQNVGVKNGVHDHRGTRGFYRARWRGCRGGCTVRIYVCVCVCVCARGRVNLRTSIHDHVYLGCKGSSYGQRSFTVNARRPRETRTTTHLYIHIFKCAYTHHTYEVRIRVNKMYTRVRVYINIYIYNIFREVYALCIDGPNNGDGSCACISFVTRARRSGISPVTPPPYTTVYGRETYGVRGAPMNAWRCNIIVWKKEIEKKKKNSSPNRFVFVRILRPVRVFIRVEQISVYV